MATVSMSFTTDVSFLRDQEWRDLVNREVSQCPLLRTSHFYLELQGMIHNGCFVSMSFTTDVSFLRAAQIKKAFGLVVSQCPLLRTSHFYKKMIFPMVCVVYGLNVLYYGRLISTRIQHGFGFLYRNVSMSFTTDVSFLLIRPISFISTMSCLNVLYNGRLISTALVAKIIV